MYRCGKNIKMYSHVKFYIFRKLKPHPFSEFIGSVVKQMWLIVPYAKMNVGGGSVRGFGRYQKKAGNAAFSDIIHIKVDFRLLANRYLVRIGVSFTSHKRKQLTHRRPRAFVIMRYRSLLPVLSSHLFMRVESSRADQNVSDNVRHATFQVCFFCTPQN